MHTESSIQNLLADTYMKCRRLITPNVGMYAWVSDLLSVTSAGMIYEYEIKISVADYRRDKKKIRHILLEGWRCPGMLPTKPTMPNKFYYVSPAGIIPVADVPNYAGLLYVTGKCIEEVKTAPWLHRFPITPKQEEFLARGLTLRYWENRRKLAGIHGENSVEK